ncbi:unnamed protein product [Acanthoscelides obtectus]|uniref:Uncharacterized protein n=1 Tax=Acanthoscelides obtectus TaxID=200917 RepID=A0A9P0P1Y4_ACAOB|nr:unnamed protein product [Acanthoscelides obtectus]CAK1658706.1 hypothetical protein AOBTE_LOCUS21077 [Acanthoscelides obtectus]
MLLERYILNKVIFLPYCLIYRLKIIINIKSQPSFIPTKANRT